MQHLVEIETVGCKISLLEAVDHLVASNHLKKRKKAEMINIFTNTNSRYIYKKMNWLGTECINPPPCFPLVNSKTQKIAAYLYAIRTVCDFEEIYTWYFCVEKPIVVSSRFLSNDETCIPPPENLIFEKKNFFSYS